MPRKKTYTSNNAYRAINRIHDAGVHRAKEVAEFIADAIHINAPRGDIARGTEHDDAGPILADSFYIRQDPTTGDYLIKSRRKYWAYVEYGTRKHGKAQPYIRPSIEAAKAYYG